MSTPTQDPNQPRIHGVYDGIEEQDNNLPNWWLGILWGTLLFGFGYWMYFHVFQVGVLPMAEWKAETEAYARVAAANKPPSDDDVLAKLAKDETLVKAGHETFTTTCAACHGQKAEGIIGPNLTDAYWLHGGKPSDIQRTITDGALQKGMPAWGPVLGAERVKALTAYVLSLKDTNVPGKEPQGDKL